MKFSIMAVLAATSYLGTATTATMTTSTTTTTEAATTPSHRRGLKSSKGSKNNDTTKVKLLAVQKGRGCSITEVELDVYNLFIMEMNPETIQFQERPGRGASTISTGNFTQDFSSIFPFDNLPNTAISFGPSNEQEGSTLIVQLSNPRPFNNGTGMKYTVKQSPSQAAVVSLEGSVVKNNNGLVDNSCSLFIDGFRTDYPQRKWDGCRGNINDNNYIKDCGLLGALPSF